jgi:hypothetical protein
MYYRRDENGKRKREEYVVCVCVYSLQLLIPERERQGTNMDQRFKKKQNMPTRI